VWLIYQDYFEITVHLSQVILTYLLSTVTQLSVSLLSTLISKHDCVRHIMFQESSDSLRVLFDRILCDVPCRLFVFLCTTNVWSSRERMPPDCCNAAINRILHIDICSLFNMVIVICY